MVLVCDVVSPLPRNTMKGGWATGGTYGRILHPTQSQDRGCDASPIQSNPSNQVGWRVVVSLCNTVSQNVNAALLQHATNLLNILHIHAGNADTNLDLAVTVLNNFELKRDAVQTENDLPAQ